MSRDALGRRGNSKSPQTSWTNKFPGPTLLDSWLERVVQRFGVRHTGNSCEAALVSVAHSTFMLSTNNESWLQSLSKPSVKQSYPTHLEGLVGLQPAFGEAPRCRAARDMGGTR